MHTYNNIKANQIQKTPHSTPINLSEMGVTIDTCQSINLNTSLTTNLTAMCKQLPRALPFIKNDKREKKEN